MTTDNPLKRKKQPNQPKPGEKRGVWWLIATWFGSGLSPLLPGTAGSIAALPFAYVIHVTLGNSALFIASFVIFVIGVWASDLYLQKMQSTADPGEIVVDEVAGQWLILSALYPTWQSYLFGLILFRIFDIVKPWPVRLADKKIKGAFGVMFDDMLAGAYPLVIFLIFTMCSAFLPVGAVLSQMMYWLGGGHG